MSDFAHHVTSRSYTETHNALIQCVGYPADANVLFVSGRIDANKKVYAGPADSEQTGFPFYCPASVVYPSADFSVLVLVLAVVWHDYQV